MGRVNFGGKLGRVVCLHTQRNGRNFWRVKSSLKLGEASLHRYYVGQKVCRICAIWHGFRDTSIFVFCNFLRKIKKLKMAAIFGGTKKFGKLGQLLSRVTLRIKIFVEIALSSMVSEI